MSTSSKLSYDADFFIRVLDSMQDLVLVKGDRSRLLWANRAFCEFYGMSNTALTEMIDAPHSDPDDTVQYVRDDYRVYVSGETLEVIEPTTGHSGDVIHCHTIKSAIREPACAEIIATVGVSRPIQDAGVKQASEIDRTDRKAVLQPLRVLIEGIETAVAVVDAQLRILTCSAAFCELFSVTEVEGRYIDEVIGQRLNLAKEYVRAIDESATTKLTNVEVELETRTGWFDIHTRPWLLSSTQTGGAMLSITDVTELRENERRLEQLNADLARSNAELEEFAYVAAHDLQEPIRMVGSYVNLLREEFGDTLGEDGQAYVQFASDGALRMQALVQDLLHFSLVGRRQLELETVSLNTAVSAVLDDLGPLLAENQVDVKIDDDGLPEVQGDAALLRQLFANLLTNAAKFKESSRSPLVQISAVRESDHWRLRVQDNGIGLNPEYAEQIFNMFTRLHRASEYPGTGIGLAICKRVVERHGGTMGVESALGIGSTFWFTLQAC